MSSFFRLFSVRAASVACAAMLATGAASASVIFSENFSQAQTNSTNASYPTGLIDNTGFFAHHGLWAPGVRLFRRLGFTAKALIVLLSFALPVGALLALQLRTLADTALDGRKELTRQQVDTVHHLLAY